MTKPGYSQTFQRAGRKVRFSPDLVRFTPEWTYSKAAC
jgi:hypothetical protein